MGKSDGRPNVGYVNAAKCIELVMNNGWDPVAKCEMGLKTGDPNTFTSIKDFEEALHKQIVHFVKIMCEAYKGLRNARSLCTKGICICFGN